MRMKIGSLLGGRVGSGRASKCVIIKLDYSVVSDTSKLSFSHHIWLRDHCRCSECFHARTKQRLLDTFSVSGHLESLFSLLTSSRYHPIFPHLTSPLKWKVWKSRVCGLLCLFVLQSHKVPLIREAISTAYITLSLGLAQAKLLRPANRQTLYHWSGNNRQVHIGLMLIDLLFIYELQIEQQYTLEQQYTKKPTDCRV